MATGSEITELFRSSVCSCVELEELGIDEYMVHTGFSYSDGDELHIVLNTSGKKWVLTDEGHTMMWLSYEDHNMTASRNDLLSRIVSSNSVQMDDGRIKAEFDPETAGRALCSVIQAMLRVSDLRFLDAER